MTTTQLLAPRYECISPVPLQSWAKVGLVFKHESGNVYSYLDNGTTWDIVAVFPFSDYPKLFRLLDWYESIEVSDLPEYVCDAFIPKDSEYHKVYKVTLYDFEDNTIIANGAKFTLTSFLRNRIPSTEQEFLKQNK